MAFWAALPAIIGAVGSVASTAGSLAGGGSATQQNQTMPWGSYVPKNVREAHKRVFPQLEAKVGVGLTPEEKEQYRSALYGGVDRNYQSQVGQLGEYLARTGVGADSDAARESYSDLSRMKAMSLASGLNDMNRVDLQRKDVNTDRFLQLLMGGYKPISSGQTASINPGLGDYLTAGGSVVSDIAKIFTKK